MFGDGSLDYRYTPIFRSRHTCIAIFAVALSFGCWDELMDLSPRPRPLRTPPPPYCTFHTLGHLGPLYFFVQNLEYSLIYTQVGGLRHPSVSLDGSWRKKELSKPSLLPVIC